jgi:integrase/recombinase XerD
MIEVKSPGSTGLPAVIEPRPTAYQVGDVPALVAELGTKAKERFATFFIDNIRNPNTRQAYFRAAFQFFQWCEARRLTVETAESFHVAAYVEELGRERAKPTVKQHLAAIRMLYDRLIVGQVVAANPAHAVRGPKHVVTEGQTPILDADQMKLLLEAIDVTSVEGLRDRALIGVMTATFGRGEAALGMNVGDCFPDGKHWSIRPLENNSKVVTIPVRHKLEKYLDAYVAVVGGAEAFPFETGSGGRPTKRQALFLSTRGRSRVLTDNRMSRQDAWRMMKRQAASGVFGGICNHSFVGRVLRIA